MNALCFLIGLFVGAILGGVMLSLATASKMDEYRREAVEIVKAEFERVNKELKDDRQGNQNVY